ncbi:MAG: NADH:flavin oxidoreductase/NADH oxidase [Bacillota bacterium]
MKDVLLFSPLDLRGLTVKNRIFVSPMCMYSAQDGIPNEWHLVHLGSRAVGGAGLLTIEATGVTPEGRISPGCLGLWNKSQVEKFKPITAFIKQQNAIPAIQLAHAGRKASCSLGWQGSKPIALTEGGWKIVGPSPLAFSDNYQVPHELTIQEIQQLVHAFTRSTQLALEAGFQCIELHMAHGYLMHQFLSPHSNHRTDSYGGSFENRIRFPLEVVEAVRKVLPDNLPLMVRISATEWKEGTWDIEQSIRFAEVLKKHGVDLIDCSTGGNIPGVKIPLTPGYQVPYAEQIRKATGIKTGAVGLITDPDKAEEILQHGQADAIFLARELLRDPYWPLHAAKKLGVEVPWPPQYERAK